MPTTEIETIRPALIEAAALAEQTSEAFVMAVTAAYIAGLEQGRKTTPAA